MFDLKTFLHQEVKPALGCTEPGAVALAVARACQELDSRDEILRVSVKVSDNIYKNGMAVGIPGVQGARGNTVAAALAVTCGQAEYELEVLKGCHPKDVSRAIHLVQQGRVQVVHDPNRHGVYVEATVLAPGHAVTSTIEGDHATVVKVVKDGKTILENLPAGSHGKAPSITDQMATLSFCDLFRAADQMDADDIAYLMEGVRMNRAIAEYALTHVASSELNLGRTLHELMAEQAICEGLGYQIRAYCYAATEARMAGAGFPVMSSAGSGNCGITAVLPVALMGEHLKKRGEEIAKALLVSHLTTSYIKARVGRLSPVCGCSVAAGGGATAGMVLLLGSGVKEASRAIRTLLADTAGMFCDGAKESCALKVGTAAHEAYLAALFAVRGKGVDRAQGVADPSVERTIENVARINQEGMKEVDRVIIAITGSQCDVPAQSQQD